MWATIDDVLDRWIGGDAPCDAVKIEAWISDAETLILADYPDIEARITSGTLSVDRVRLVVARMVSRAFRNPAGTRTTQETNGPFSASLTFGGDSPGDLWLTSDERNLLSGRGSVRQRAFTIPTSSADLGRTWLTPDWWVPAS